LFGELIMLKSLALAAIVAVAALPAAAQSTNGPTPNEQNGMHTGTTVTNGSAVIVRDQQGIHPEGYPGMAVRNRATGDSGPATHHHHHRHHTPTEPSPG
jgi:hypothetical protein